MAYSPNDRGPDIPPTRKSVRISSIWLGIIALVMIGGIIWTQQGEETDPSTTASTTAAEPQQTLPASPGPEAPESTQTEPQSGSSAGTQNGQ